MENSVLDVVGFMDPTLTTSALLMTSSNKLIFCRLIKYKIISIENGYKGKSLLNRNPLLQRINVEIWRRNLYFDFLQILYGLIIKLKLQKIHTTSLIEKDKKDKELTQKKFITKW